MNPTGKGVLVYLLANCAGGNPVHFASMVRDAGISWVALKAANGTADSNSTYLAGAVAALRGVGIQVWGWQYVYGGNIYTGWSIAKQEADAAVRNIQRYAFTGWLIDPEKEYKRPGASVWVDTYMTALRATFPDLPIGLCSYRFPTLHPELPWANFLRHCNFHAPQVYWMGAHNPAWQLERSRTELLALKQLPFVPVGAAFKEGDWRPTVSDLNEFDAKAHALDLPGVSWWAWDDEGIETYPEYMAAITAHVWSTPVPPPIDWQHAITTWARTQGYIGPEPE